MTSQLESIESVIESRLSSQEKSTSREGVEDETASRAEVDSEERCERVRERREDEEEIEVEVIAKPTREIEILCEQRNTRKTGNLLSNSSRAGEQRLKHQVVVFVGKWMKKNVGSFDFSEANMMVVQGKSRQFCDQINLRRSRSSNTPLDAIQLSVDEKAFITKDLEKLYSS